MNNDIQSTLTRTLIKQGIAQKLDADYSFSKGTVAQWFRKIEVKPWTPGNTVRPAATIVDFGTRKSGKVNSATTKNKTLSGQIILDIEAQLTREEVIADWSDRVEMISIALQNYKAAGGILRLDVTADDPFEVVLGEGKSENIWVIEFECEYFIEVSALE